VPAHNTVVVPGPVVGAYQRWRWTAVWCYPRQMTWRLERDATTHYLKVGLEGDHPGLRAEAERTRWAASWLPVPEVLDVGTDGTVEWLVTAGLDGRPATDPDLGEPRDVAVAWAEGLRRFHELAPVRDCPFDFRLHTALDHVRRRVAAGRVDATEDFNEDHRHLDTAQAALRQLEQLRPTGEDLVVCHGDYCPPNTLLRGKRVSASSTSASSRSPTAGGTWPSARGRPPGTMGPASNRASSPPTAPSLIPTGRPSTACCTTLPPDTYAADHPDAAMTAARTAAEWLGIGGRRRQRRTAVPRGWGCSTSSRSTHSPRSSVAR
jgi:kanamycin kinase